MRILIMLNLVKMLGFITYFVVALYLVVLLVFTGLHISLRFFNIYFWIVTVEISLSLPLKFWQSFSYILSKKINISVKKKLCFFLARGRSCSHFFFKSNNLHYIHTGIHAYTQHIQQTLAFLPSFTRCRSSSSIR